MKVSYSFHISSKSNAITGTNKLVQASKHNLRGYESKDYDRSLISIMRGSDNILNDVKEVYEREFSESLTEYNKKVRADRKIDDYLEHVSNSRSDCAVEVIIQVGDKEFWKDKEIHDKKVMAYIFEDQIRSLSKLCPEFKVASAVAHYDESSPHLHIVGVPVAEGYQKGMSKQCAKTKVFTQARLSMLQDQMRQRAEKGIELNRGVFGDVELKEKEKGRNKDIPKQSLDEYYKLQEEIKQQEGQIEKNEIALNKIKGELVSQESLRERTVDKTLLGKSKDTVTMPYEEYQALHHLATVQKDVKELHQELEYRLAAVTNQKRELDDMRVELEHMTSEASDRLNNAPKYKEMYKTALDEIRGLKKANTSLEFKLEQSEELVEHWHSRAVKGQEVEKELSFFHRLVGKFSEYVRNTLNKLLDFEEVFNAPDGELSRRNREISSYGDTKGVYADWSRLSDNWQYYWKDSEGNEQNSNYQGALKLGYLPLVKELAREDEKLTNLLDKDILDQAKEVQAQHQHYHHHSRGR